MKKSNVSVKVSSPGKVHLIGEHSVVYGEPAIIAAIGKRCYVEAEKDDAVTITSQNFGKSLSFVFDEVKAFNGKITELWNEAYKNQNFSNLFSITRNDPINYAKVAVCIALEKMKMRGGVSLNINSEIPFGAGLGSGAALAVATIKALSELYDKNLSTEKINNIAFEVEKFAHGTPSGGDNSASCYGGLIWFEKGNPNKIKSLKKEVPYELNNFVLIETKKSGRTTGELVQLVRSLKEDYRNKRIKAIGKLTYEMLEVLKNKGFIKMKEIINEAQKNLAELGVSIPEIDEICSSVRKIDGAAKLCGAGGGGVVLCYHKNKAKLMETLKDLGYRPIEAELGVEGVRIE